MKQITNNTVLIQGDKSYSAIQTEQGIVWVDKDAEIKENNYVYHPEVSKEYTIVNTKKEGNDRYSKGEHISQGIYKHKPTTNPWYLKEVKIIAANFDLDGVPKIEFEDEVEELARQWYKTKTFYTNNPNQRSINGFIAGCKANQTKYTEEEVEKMIIISNSDGRLTTKQEIKNFTSNQYAKQLLQSFNSIKEITVDENFKQI